MAKNNKPRLFGGIGSAIAGLWQGYAYWTTASQLPSDAGWIAKMITDPPVYLPWLVLLGFLITLGWSFWPGKEELDAETGGNQQTTRGPQSPNYGSVEGGVHNYFGPPNPAEKQESKSPYGSGRLPNRSKTTGSQSPVIADSNFRDLNITQSTAPQRTVRVQGDLPIADAIDHIRQVIKDTDQSNGFPATRRAIRQAGHVGTIEVWGRKSIPFDHMDSPEECFEIWSCIDQDYWHAYKIVALAADPAAREMPHTEAEPHVRYSVLSNRYWDLMLVRSEVLKKWRKPPPPPGDLVPTDWRVA